MFNFGPGNEHLGNKVVLTSPTEAYDCDIHEDGNTEQLITCYTRPMPPDLYNIQITVDGQLIDDKRICRGKINHWHCTHRTYKHLSPEIIKITPIASRPGGMLKIDGKIFTDLFGSSNSTASNGRVEKIVRSRVRDEKYFLSRAGKLYQVQTYAEIKSVEPREGSVLGGTLLTIKGKNFDETTAKAKVFVGGRPCVITSKITDDSILCEVDSKPEHMPLIHAGNRGLKIESWDIGAQSFSKLRSFNSTTSGYMEGWNDNGEYSTSKDRKSIRMLGFLVPIYSGRQTLKLNGNGPSQIWLSTNESKEFMRRTENVEIDLIKDKRYYIEVLYENRYAKPTSEVLARMFSKNSSVTQSQTGYSRNMKQRIVLSTTEVNETMIIKLNELNKTESSDDIQSLIIRKNSPQTDGAKFKLKFGKAVTLPLPGTASAKDIQYALDSLPSLTRMVRVVENSTGNTTDFYIFLKLPIGSLPLIEVEHVPDYNGNKLDISLTKMANGKASNRHFAFTLDGVMSSPLSVKATAEQISTALNKMFAVTCPSYISSPPKGTYGYFNDFENPSDYNHNGEAVSDRTPFCGKVSVKNPSVIYYNDKYQLSLEKFPFLCTALHGDADFVMKVNFQYRTNPTVNPTSRTTYIPTHLTYLTEWKYICWDVLDSIKVTGGIMYKLKEIKIERKNNLILLMDAISLKFITDGTIMSELAGATVRQLPPLNPRLAMKQVKVEKLITNVFRITFDVHNCTDKLPTFQTLPKEILPSSQEMLQSSGNVAVEILKNITPGIWTLMKASPPLEGSFRVSFNGEQSESGTQITIDGYGFSPDMMVKMEDDYCSDVSIAVDQITCITPSKIGNLAVTPIQVTKANDQISGEFNYTYTKPTADITGINLGSSKVTGGDVLILTGNNLNDPFKLQIGRVPANIMASNSTNVIATLPPQGPGIHDIQLTIGNGFAAISSPIKAIDQTLYVSNVSPRKGSLFGGTRLTITGNGFLVDKDLIHIKVGEDTLCEVEDYSNTWIRCTLQYTGKTHKVTNQGIHSDTPASPGNVSCNASDSVIGSCNESPLTSKPDAFYFHFSECSTPVVNSMTPSEGTSKDEITIRGNRLSKVRCENIVKFGQYMCPTIEESDTKIVCKIETKNTYPIGILVPLTLKIENRGFALLDFSDDRQRHFGLLPHIDSISPNKGSTFGGTTISIAGAGFVHEKSSVEVTIGYERCDVKSVSYTYVLCVTPKGTAGQSPPPRLQLLVVNGNRKVPTVCKISKNCTFTYDDSLTPVVTSASPINVTGSGVELTINGNKFGNEPRKIHVETAGVSCKVTTVKNNEIKCSTGDIPAGNFPLHVYKEGIGNLDTNNISLHRHPYLKEINPSSGSFQGGTYITIKGNGFVANDTTVTIHNKNCAIISVSATMIMCETPANSLGIKLLRVVSNGETYPTGSFIYDNANTPNIISISPSNGQAGDTLTLVGVGFSSSNDQNDVRVGDSKCTVFSATSNSLKCTLAHQKTGAYPVKVRVHGKGFSTGQNVFNYDLHLKDFLPSSGSLFGGQRLTITGSGFDPNNTVVTLCSKPCITDKHHVQNTSNYICITPSKNANMTNSCNVSVAVGNSQKTSSNLYTYKESDTAQISSVLPNRGGTRGGTKLTITGSGFSSDPNQNHVTIAGSLCNVSLATTTSVVCRTSQHQSVDSAKVELTVENKGGILEFDKKDVELRAENILITDGGRLQIGTEEEPFQHKAIITMYGNLRSKELPIYGAKTLAVRNGTLCLHGRRLLHTWTHLMKTVKSGEKKIVLKHPVPGWRIGDHIVIASTGGRHSQRENEVRTIAAISPDYKELTLNKSLDYEHISTAETIDQRTVEYRAEVGLLTRNIVVRGSENIDWRTKIEACPDGFDTGEFATQTCFQGRFGEEMGSDEFGAQIMLHAPVRDKNLAVAHLSYIEVTFAGQAFRLGRYPIHFHLNGDMSKSYVRGCSVHRSFNRAINVHGSHNTLVEHNVVYDIMGGAIFLEDGIETGNTFQYNLVVFAKPSTSLQNDDITPASFWNELILRDLDGTLTGTPYGQVLPSVDILPPTCQNVPGFNHVLITQEKDKVPDRFTLDKVTFIPRSLGMPTYKDNSNGDWFFNTTEKTLTYLISDRARLTRTKRSLSTARDISVNFQAYRCFYLNCEPPKDKQMQPPVPKRPNVFFLWSSLETWKKANEILNLSLQTKIPEENENVTIPTGMWIVVDIDLPKFNTIYIYGQMEVSNKLSEVTISANYIHIVGGRLIVGWENDPYPGNATIELRGSQQTPQFDVKSGPNLGSKVIGVFGGLDMHALKRKVLWTRLASTAKIGTKTLVLEEAVDWKVGEEIVLSSTGYNAWETETFRIDSVSADGTQLTLNATVAHEHIVHQETINQNQIKIAADVGLFTRNIKVIGKDYNNLYKEMFGARIIVGVTQTEQDKVFVGYIRLSNVEFYHSGQYGWATKNDPRYSVALHNLGTIDHRLRPTYVRNCSFHDGFSTAIGIYSSHTVTIDNNIIHHTIGSGIISNSDNTTLLNNLVTLVICPDVYVWGLNFKGGIKWQAGIEAIQVEGLDLRNNIVAGSQRIGYRINGEYCTEVSSWTGNIVRGALLGIAVFDFDVSSKKTECVKYTGFQISRCTDAGIYHNNRPGFIVEKCIFIENSLGVFPFVIGPPSLTHQTSSKEVVIRDSTFVGLTSSYDCSIDRLSKADPNIAYSSLSRSNTDGWTVAIVCPTYTSGSNKAPDKPFFNIMSYPAIDGVMKIHGVTFAHFNSRCVNKMKTVVLKSAPFNEDGQHPVHMHQCRKVDVDTNSLVFIQRPNVNQKKVLILDSDGSFIDSGDSPISVFSVSEWEWGGDKRRGLGDYRIPKEARAYPNGSKMPIEELATGRGIIRNPNCVLRNQWQAYQCNNSEYAMMIIESLDEDTETRRLSPVAIVGNKYIDLINGPQDHGWCSGYTCRKRISTFMAIVDPTYPFDIYFSSITPQKLRLHLLNSDKKISVSVYYQVPNRQDVYDYTNTFILPKSAYMDNGEMKYKTVKESNRKTFLPTTADVVAENFFDRWEQKVYVIVEGGKPVDIRVNPIVVVTFSFGGVSESEFFGENLVRNLALFLGIPASKVRIVDIVKEGAARRKKRAVSGVKVTTEIGDQPSNESNVTNSSVPTNSSLSSQSLQNISSQLVNSRQLKSLDQHLKYQIVSMAMTPPVVPVTDPNWSKTQQTNSTFTVKVPDKLKLVISPKVSYEGGVFNQGPCLQFLDTSGNPLNILGTPENPWRISATLVKGKGSHANAVLSGTTEVSLYDGWANFTNIAISHKGSDYGLTFQVSYPSDAGKFAAKVEPSLIVPKRPLSLMITPSQFVAGKSKNLNIILIDIITKLTIPNIKWRKHKWQVKAVLVKPYLYYGSVYNIDTEVKEDTVNNQLVFNDIMFTKPGVYIIQLTTTSTPDEYTIVAEEEIRVKQSHLLVFSDPVSSSIKILVDIDYNKVGPANEKYFRVLMENYLIYKYPKVTFPEVLVSESENNMMDVFVKLYGNINEVSATSKMICDMAKEQQKITFNSHQAYIIFSIQVNGTRFLGSSCGSKDGKVTKTKTFPLEIVVGVSVAVTLLLAGAIFFLLLKFQVIPK
ncbi:fibrocystin-L [Octopus bimaculoides]|uniref:fibrocystin-L n=1 Tax=Octopus bimaculoides TaxID=37653 RepID=UPI0022E8E464|nr:fibrocystin-L [Octopus bimaculoides]